jgi:ketosteroid isomerase-like protein
VEPGGGDSASLRAAVGRFGALVGSRDISIVDEFAPDGMLVGSEPGEIVRGHAELRPFFERLLALPARITWEWETMDVHEVAPIGWVFAEGVVVLAESGSARRLPYRLSAVLECIGGGWKWRLFHGSEPKV